MRSWVTINRLVIVCNEWCLLVWLILAVCAETNFISVKMSFAASTTLCGATWCATALDQVQQSLWGSRTSHPLDFNGWMTRTIISTFSLAEPAIAMPVGQEESSQGEELGVILQPGSWHTGRAQIERRVLAEDLKIARRDNKGGRSYVNQFFIMLMTSPKSGKRSWTGAPVTQLNTLNDVKNIQGSQAHSTSSTTSANDFGFLEQGRPSRS